MIMGREQQRGWSLPQDGGTAFLVISSLLLILVASVTIWQRTCQEAGTPSCFVFSETFVPLLTALGACGAGVLGWRARRDQIVVNLFLFGSITLTAGTLSSVEVNAGWSLFVILFAFLSPLLVHLHLHLLLRPVERYERWLLLTLYCAAVALCVPVLVWPAPEIKQKQWYDFWLATLQFNMAVAAIFSTLLLWHAYRSEAAAHVRRRVRFVAFGTLAAFAPLVLLSLLPNALSAQVYVPYEWTFPWFMLGPLAYSYSLLHPSLLGTEALFRRGAIVYLLGTILLAFYLLVVNYLYFVTTHSEPHVLVGGTVLIVASLLLYVPLQSQVHHLVNWIWYGPQTSYSHIIDWLTRELSLALEQERLRHLLLEELPAVMRLEKAALFLREDSESLKLLNGGGFAQAEALPKRLALSGQIISYLERDARPRSQLQVRHSVEVTTVPEEQHVLSCKEIAYWLPLVSNDRLQGLLLIGYRAEDDIFTDEDERIFATVARQAGIAAHNVRLVAEVEARREELGHAHQQLLVERELERRRLARDLHDETVQQLIGISYLIQSTQRQLRQQEGMGPVMVDTGAVAKLEAIREEVVKGTRSLRRLIRELRPTGLEHVGLAAALEDFVGAMQSVDGQPKPRIELKLDPRPDPPLPEPITLCLFRVAQEALRNAQEHGRATCIELVLRNRAGEVELTIRDNGRGFHVPHRLSELTRTGHFGLIGITERIGLVGGTYHISSEPGHGTEIVARVPLDGKHYDWNHTRLGSG